MIDQWYLIITLFVLQADGIIDKRQLHSITQESEAVCKLEATARFELFKSQLGETWIHMYQTSPNSIETYRIGLNGKFVGFQVGCENQPHPDTREWDYIND